MLRNRTRVAAIVLFAAASAHAAATRVLFIGNSFTFGHADPVKSYNAATVTDLNHLHYGGVPALFKQMTVQAGLDEDVTIEAVGGKPLSFHVDTESAVLTAVAYDVVVLQGLSTEPLPADHGGKPDAFMAGVADLQKLVRSKNPAATVYLYETWASPTGVSAGQYPAGLDGLKQMEADLRRASDRAAADAHLAGTAPVGEAFTRALATHVARPDPAGPAAAGVDLWYADHRHAGPLGSYLSAAVLFATLTGHDPRTLTAGEGTAAAAMGVSPELAAKLHRLAYDTVQARQATTMPHD